jgi:hypothetical protein
VYKPHLLKTSSLLSRPVQSASTNLPRTSPLLHPCRSDAFISSSYLDPLRILNTRIQSVPDRNRPHTQPTTRSIAEAQRILEGEVFLSLDSTQVQTQAARRTRVRASSRRREGNNGGSAGRGEARDHGWIHGERIVAEGIGCWERWRCDGGSGRLGQAEMAFRLAGDVEGACAESLGMVISMIIIYQAYMLGDSRCSGKQCSNSPPMWCLR